MLIRKYAATAAARSLASRRPCQCLRLLRMDCCSTGRTWPGARLLGFSPGMRSAPFSAAAPVDRCLSLLGIPPYSPYRQPAAMNRRLHLLPGSLTGCHPDEAGGDLLVEFLPDEYVLDEISFVGGMICMRILWRRCSGCARHHHPNLADLLPSTSALLSADASRCVRIAPPPCWRISSATVRQDRCRRRRRGAWLVY